MQQSLSFITQKAPNTEAALSGQDQEPAKLKTSSYVRKMFSAIQALRQSPDILLVSYFFSHFFMAVD